MILEVLYKNGDLLRVQEEEGGSIPFDPNMVYWRLYNPQTGWQERRFFQGKLMPVRYLPPMCTFKIPADVVEVILVLMDHGYQGFTHLMGDKLPKSETSAVSAAA